MKRLSGEIAGIPSKPGSWVSWVNSPVSTSSAYSSGSPLPSLVYTIVVSESFGPVSTGGVTGAFLAEPRVNTNAAIAAIATSASATPTTRPRRPRLLSGRAGWGGVGGDGDG